jgi:hypothetical protein
VNENASMKSRMGNMTTDQVQTLTSRKIDFGNERKPPTTLKMKITTSKKITMTQKGGSSISTTKWMYEHG